MCNRTQRNDRPHPHPNPKRSRLRAAYPPLAPSSAYAHQMPDDSESARVPACQGLPARKSLAHLLPVVSDHASIWLNRSSRSGGSLRFQSPETLPHPPRPVKGFPEDRSPASRDAHHLPHGRLAAARRGRSLASPEPNDYRTSTLLCQVPGPARSRAGLLRLVEATSATRGVWRPASYYVEYVAVSSDASPP